MCKRYSECTPDLSCSMVEGTKMEVTRKNFKECLQSVQKDIKDATFISIDGEFTGLDSAQYSQIAPYDYPEERYQKIRQGSCDFLLIQFGLCAFRFIEETQKYEVKPYNFYIFQRPYSRHAPDHRFLCQSSSLDFLASHGFDFNKVIRDGISYLTPTQEASLREVLVQQHQTTLQFSSPLFTSPDGINPVSAKGPVAVPDEQKNFIDSVLKKIADFMQKDGDQTLELPSSSGFQRKLIYQTVRQKYKSGIHLQTKTGEKKRRFVVVTRVSDEDKMKEIEAVKQDNDQMELDDAVGFTKVIRMLSESCKLIIGHNMLLDLAHILHQFYYPLPESYEEFKSLTRCVFPRLLDTKLMASTHPFKENIYSTALGELLKIMQIEPFQIPEYAIPEEFAQYTVDSEQHHDAGFDAFITGLCFASMANHLGSFQQPPLKNVLPMSLIEPFLNKIFLMKSPDIPYMDLAGIDLKPKRENVFHVTFPKEWKTPDLLQLFSPFGNINISWLDEVSAFVSIYKKENASAVLQSLCQEGTTCTVTSFEKFKMKDGDQDSQSHTVRKRSVPMVDIEIPSKKRRSLNADTPSEFGVRVGPTYPPACCTSAPPFQSRYITPIPEESEEQEQNGGTSNSKTKPDGDVFTEQSMDTDVGTEKSDRGKQERMTTGSPKKKKKALAKNKLFDEPETW